MSETVVSFHSFCSAFPRNVIAGLIIDPSTPDEATRSASLRGHGTSRPPATPLAAPRVQARANPATGTGLPLHACPRRGPLPGHGGRGPRSSARSSGWRARAGVRALLTVLATQRRGHTDASWSSGPDVLGKAGHPAARLSPRLPRQLRLSKCTRRTRIREKRDTLCTRAQASDTGVRPPAQKPTRSHLPTPRPPPSAGHAGTRGPRGWEDTPGPTAGKRHGRLPSRRPGGPCDADALRASGVLQGPQTHLTRSCTTAPSLTNQASVPPRGRTHTAALPSHPATAPSPQGPPTTPPLCSAHLMAPRCMPTRTRHSRDPRRSCTRALRPNRPRARAQRDSSLPACRTWPAKPPPEQHAGRDKAIHPGPLPAPSGPTSGLWRDKRGPRHL